MESAIPESVLEAGRIDGATEYRMFYSVVMPAVKPAWLTLVIFTFQSFWNVTGVSFVYDESLKTLPSVLSTISLRRPRPCGRDRGGCGHPADPADHHLHHFPKLHQ